MQPTRGPGCSGVLIALLLAFPLACSPQVSLSEILKKSTTEALYLSSLCDEMSVVMTAFAELCVCCAYDIAQHAHDANKVYASVAQVFASLQDTTRLLRNAVLRRSDVEVETASSPRRKPVAELAEDERPPVEWSARVRWTEYESLGVSNTADPNVPKYCKEATRTLSHTANNLITVANAAQVRGREQQSLVSKRLTSLVVPTSERSGAANDHR